MPERSAAGPERSLAVRISKKAVHDQALTDLATQAVRLFLSADFDALAESFGYAVALGRDPAHAIRNDFETGLADVGATGLHPSRQHAVTVSYFEPNVSGLFALVECFLPTNGRADLLMELIVTGRDEDRYVALEEIGAAVRS